MFLPHTDSSKTEPETGFIEFLCAAEDEGVIAPPVPAKEALPDWFRKLPAVDRERQSATDNGLTVKRCMPFLDAMMTGWILPLAATVRLSISDGGKTVNAGWEFDKVMVSNHHSYQVQGNPWQPVPPCKFHNHWTVTTPEGWSCLFIPPLNRPQPLFQVFSGIVDTDSYRSPVHFPFVATAADGVHVIEKGTPLMQVIPFKRETSQLNYDIRAEGESETRLREKIRRNTQSEEGWYRRHSRAQR